MAFVCALCDDDLTQRQTHIVKVYSSVRVIRCSIGTSTFSGDALSGAHYPLTSMQKKRSVCDVWVYFLYILLEE